MTPRCRPAKFPAAQSAVIGANIRALRLNRGWTLAKLGELMGWQALSTVCAAEGRRSSYQRRYTAAEVEQLAVIFGVSPEQLNTRCVNCGGQPPAGFGCLTCGAAAPIVRRIAERADNQECASGGKKAAPGAPD
jgi:transcriptional regulator with XRE-family HTH domain